LAQDGVSVGIPSPDPSGSAIFHVDAPDNNKGMLIPRLTTTQRDNIIKPAHGLIIFNESTQAFNYCHVAGVDTTWVQLIPTPSTFDLDMGDNTITNLADGTNEKYAVNRSQLDAVDSDNLDRNGTEFMTGNLNMGGRRIYNLLSAGNSDEAVTKGQFDSKFEGESFGKKQVAWERIINGGFRILQIGSFVTSSMASGSSRFFTMNHELETTNFTCSNIY